MLKDSARKFLDATGWRDATIELLTGDASARKYVRLKKGGSTAILMDASRLPGIVGQFVWIDRHLIQLGFSAPEIIAQDRGNYFLLLEDFGDTTFAQLLDDGHEPEKLFTLAMDVLVALHKHPLAVPDNLCAYSPEKMLEDLELFLVWLTPGISEAGKTEFRKVWREVLPVAHKVPDSLLLRDYHVANLMLLPARDDIRQAGLLDFQDAYRGPVSYDLVSLLEDARRDVPEDLKQEMFARYLAQFPLLDRDVFGASTAILAALRHTRVLAIFEKLSRTEEKHDYKNLHSPRVEHLLQNALRHPMLAGVKKWFAQYVRQN
jgi:aminoglycoside/choline kinase family phosphotransferase